MIQDYQRRGTRGGDSRSDSRSESKPWPASGSLGTQVRAAAGMLARVVATAAIWMMAIGMMALCIPLGKVTDISVLPLFIVAGATLSTAVVWLRGYRIERNAAVELAATQQRLRELEERLANLETINGFERRLAEEAAARQTAHPETAHREPVPECDSAAV